MDTNKRSLCVLLFLCGGFCAVLSVSQPSVTTSVIPDPAVKGSNSPHTITCDFTISEKDTFDRVSILSESSTTLVVLSSLTPNPLWATDAPESLKSRSKVYGSVASKNLSLEISDTRCDDDNRVYRCRLAYITPPNSGETSTFTTVAVTSRPQTPDEMVVRSSSEAGTLPPPTEDDVDSMINVTEFSSVTFECGGNVGKPAGSFLWYTAVGQGKPQQIIQLPASDNITDSTPVEVAGDCSFTAQSRLAMNLTRVAGDEPLVVYCVVSHPSVDRTEFSGCSNSSQDLCRKSSKINVHYPVKDIINRTVNIEEGTTKTVLCGIKGNPQPHLIEWRKDGENVTVMTGDLLTFNNASLTNTGTFTCTAYNVIDGLTMKASGTVFVTVETVTTPLPTTTQSAEKAHDKGDSKTVIIVVVVVVGVSLIALIATIVFIRRRIKQKEVKIEEPPEKPHNRNPGINTLSVQQQNQEQPQQDVEQSNSGSTMSTDTSTVGSQSDTNTNKNKNKDGLTYADLQFDNKPRSRRPLAVEDSHTEYADISMPKAQGTR